MFWNRFSEKISMNGDNIGIRLENLARKLVFEKKTYNKKQNIYNVWQTVAFAGKIHVAEFIGTLRKNSVKIGKNKIMEKNRMSSEKCRVHSISSRHIEDC